MSGLYYTRGYLGGGDTSRRGAPILLAHPSFSQDRGKRERCEVRGCGRLMSPAAFSPLRRRGFLRARSRVHGEVRVYLRQPQVKTGRCACEAVRERGQRNKKGAKVRSSFGSGQPSESGSFLDPSGHIVLECACGEKLVLLGQEQDWREEGRTVFRCECGRELTLAEDRADKRALSTGELLRRSIKAPRGV